MSRIAVIYYSSTGHVHQMAQAVAEGAEEQGAEVRLRKVAELAPEEVIRQQDAWNEHHLATKDAPRAELSDLEWADGFAFGTPTRFGNVASQLKQFLDTAGPLWAQGKLADKVATSFTSAQNPHGGLESTLLALNNVLYHWGAILVPPGYTDERLLAAGGNPYGASFASGGGGGEVSAEALAACRVQGARLARFADLVRAPEREDRFERERARTA